MTQEELDMYCTDRYGCTCETCAARIIAELRTEAAVRAEEASRRPKEPTCSVCGCRQSAPCVVVIDAEQSGSCFLVPSDWDRRVKKPTCSVCHPLFKKPTGEAQAA